MKKIYIACLLMFAGAANAIQICGPKVADVSYEYSDAEKLASGLRLGFWAVGKNCDGGETEILGDDGFVSATAVYGMCGGINSADNIVAAGQAFCSDSYWSVQTTTEFDEKLRSDGPNCWCRRTKMLNKDNVVVDSVGLWVLVGNTQNSFDSCKQSCAELCAKNIAYDASHGANGEIGQVSAGNAIMVLSVY